MASAAVERAILDLLRARRPTATLCPSDVARAIDGTDWRRHLPAVRDAAWRLTTQGRAVVLKGGRPIAPNEALGPIRIGRPAENR